MIQKVTRHQSVSAKTANILYRVLDYMEKEKNRVDMTAWGRRMDAADKTFIPDAFGFSEQKIPPCGTTSCLGGTVCLITNKGRDFLKQSGVKLTGNGDNSPNFPECGEMAREIAGLNEEQKKDLFYFSSWLFNNDADYGWPEQFEARYKKAKTGAGRFQAVKQRVLYFIRTGR